MSSPSPTAPPPEDRREIRPVAVFESSEHWFAVSVDRVVEIAPWTPPVPLPKVPPYIDGLLNLRGRAIPLLNLPRYLELSVAPEVPQRVVVIEADGMRVGIHARRVSRVFEPEPQSWRWVEALQGERLLEVTEAELHLEEGLAAVLDVKQLLHRSKIS